MAQKSTIPAVKVGTPVIYVGTKGKQKLALVVGTPETIEEGTSLPTLNEGQVHLAVWGFNGGFRPRLNVPFESVIADDPEFTNDEGQPVGFWKLT